MNGQSVQGDRICKEFALEEVNDLFRNKDNLIYIFELNGKFIQGT